MGVTATWVQRLARSGVWFSVLTGLENGNAREWRAARSSRCHAGQVLRVLEISVLLT